MKEYKDLAQYAIEQLKRQGAQDISCYVSIDTNTEASYEQGDFSMLRTFQSSELCLKGVANQQAAEVRISSPTRETVDRAVEECAAQIRRAAEDPYEGIAEKAVRQNFCRGPEGPDVNAMLYGIQQLMNEEAQAGETLSEPYTLVHRLRQEVCLNTNGVELESCLGFYSTGLEQSISSHTADISHGLSALKQMEEPYQRSIWKSEPITLSESFDGTLIFSPRMLRLYWWFNHMGLFSPDATIGFRGKRKHLWVNKFGQQVTSPCFNLSNRPLDENVCCSSPFSPEGYLSQNTDLIKDGILQELLYTGRCARALGREANCAASREGILITNTFIQPGKQSIRDMISGVEKGVLVHSLKGTIPREESGDFSGLAVNALLIKNGEIQGLLKNATIRGNFYDMQQNIRGLSRECWYTGNDAIPWIAFNGLTIE